MALTLEVQGKQLAFGLNWASAPTGRGSSGKIADLGVQYRASHKVFLKEQGQYGFLEAGGRLPSRVKKGTALSGAALFASLLPIGQDGIFVYTVESKKKAIIVVVADGLIYQDVVVSLGAGLDRMDSGPMKGDGTFEFAEEAAIRKIQEKIDQIYNETPKEFIPYGNFYQTFPNSLEMDLDLLLEGDVDNASLSKFSDPRTAIKVGCASLVIFSLMWGFQQYREQERKRKEREAIEQQVDPMDSYRSNLGAVLAQAKFPAVEAERAIAVRMRAREIELGGWALEKHKCDSSGTCEETWKLVNGTAASFAEANPQKGEVTGYADGLTSFGFGYKTEAKAVVLDPSALPTADSFAVSVVALAQSLAAQGVVITWDKVPSLDFSLPAGVTPGMVTAGEGVARAKFEISGASGLEAEALASMPDNMMVTDMSFAVSDDLDSNVFSIRGFYYVKK